MPDAQGMKPAALDYARRGWAVFPCKPLGKEPITPNGLKNATTDQREIEQAWLGVPDANIGTHCGRSALVVLDEDKPNALDGLLNSLPSSQRNAVRAALQATQQATTGKGRHYYFRAPEAAQLSPRTGIVPGVDIRAGQSYVIAPPSIHENGARYEWIDASAEPLPLPQELIPLLNQRHQPATANAIRPIPEGQRDDTLTSIGGKMRRAGMSEDEIVDGLIAVNGHRCEVPLPPEQVQKIAHSVAKYPVGTARARNVRLSLTRASDIEITPIRWFMRDRIPLGELVLFEGDGGVGKSTVALSILAAATTGSLLPDGSQRGPMTVLIVAEEDSKSVLCGRLQAAGADLSRVRFVTFTDLSGAATFRIPDDLQQLRTAIEREFSDVGILYIDALFNHLGTSIDGKQLDGEKTQDAREACSPLAEMAHETGLLILATRHWTKGAKSAAERGRGSAEFRNVARSTMVFSKHPRDFQRYVAAVDKRNIAKSTPALIYRIESAPVLDRHGNPLIDEDGEPFTVSRIVWDGTEQITADTLAMAIPEADDECEARQDAREIILQTLAGGRKSAKELEQSRKAAEISKTTWDRARSMLRRDNLIQGWHGLGDLKAPWSWELTEGGQAAIPGLSRSSPRSSRSSLSEHNKLDDLEGNLGQSQPVPLPDALDVLRLTVPVKPRASGNDSATQAVLRSMGIAA